MIISEKGEKILWKGKKCFKSFLPIILVGIITLWIYGIGLLFIAYAVIKWNRAIYIITDKKVVEIIGHYAFYRAERKEIKYGEIIDLKTSFRMVLKCWKIEILGKNKKIIFETSKKEIVDWLSSHKNYGENVR